LEPESQKNKEKTKMKLSEMGGIGMGLEYGGFRNSSEESNLSLSILPRCIRIKSLMFEAEVAE